MRVLATDQWGGWAEAQEADAVAEGIERLKSGRGCYDPRYPHSAVHAGIWHPTAGDAHRALWNSLHGSAAWDQNDWVAAYTFTVSRGNIDGGAP